MADLEQLRSQAAGPEVLCARLAKILNVHHHEVALLRVEKDCLRFVFPTELRGAGALPLSGPAVAARTASTKTSLVSNKFMRVRHMSLFESVKLAGAEAEEHDSQQMPIQKIMSVPIVGSGSRVLGVVQVSRKGLDASLCGADFTDDDLKQLEKAATILAEMPFLQDGAEI